MASGSPAVELRRCSKRFGGVVALNEVSLAVMPGECIALIGPNGSGKTTLFNVISGFLEPDRGEILIGGRTVPRGGPHLRARSGIGRTFQEGRVWQDASVLENVVIAMRAGKGRLLGARAPSAAEIAQARAVMLEVGLDPAFERRDGMELPLIERRRIELARALSLGPTALLLDEIAAGLNRPESAEIFIVLARIRMRRPQLAVIAIEHKLDLLLEVTERVLFMEDGRIVLDASVERVRADPALLVRYWAPPSGRKPGGREALH